MEQVEMVSLLLGYSEKEIIATEEFSGIHIECIISNPAYNELGFLLGGADGMETTQNRACSICR